MNVSSTPNVHFGPGILTPEPVISLAAATEDPGEA